MTSATHRYRIYGLSVLSDFCLEEAETSPFAEPDLRITATDLGAHRRPLTGFRDVACLPEGDLITFAGVGRFLVRGTSEIAIDLDPEFDRRLLGLPVLGPIIAVLLHRLGYLVLHGSAVAIDGRASVFLGDKGAGKSTTAASLVAAGYPLIADDVVAIGLGPGPAVVPAGYQSMKLDAPMQRRFGRTDGYAIEPANGPFTGGKVRYRLNRPNPHDAFPLGRLHVLGRGDANTLNPYGHADALRALIRFSYFPRLGPSVLKDGEAGSLFAKAASLAASAQGCSLTVRDDLDVLPQLGDFLKQAREPSRELA